MLILMNAAMEEEVVVEVEECVEEEVIVAETGMKAGEGVEEAMTEMVAEIVMPLSKFHV